MNTNYLYLTVDLLSILVPFLWSFYSKAPFYKKWKYLGLSTLITTVFFVLWDSYFTHIGIWGFNPKYISGYYLLNLPIEELLFFICIPYACIFTYEALNFMVKKDYLFFYQKKISISLLATLLIMGVFYIDRWYTSFTFISLSLFLAFLTFNVKPAYMGRFYFTYLIILIPFLFVNGILTGSFIEGEVVWYNDEENMGIRIGTIPFEDVFYGMLMILINISIFERLQKKSKRLEIKFTG